MCDADGTVPMDGTDGSSSNSSNKKAVREDSGARGTKRTATSQDVDDVHGGRDEKRDGGVLHRLKRALPTSVYEFVKGSATMILGRGSFGVVVMTDKKDQVMKVMIPSTVALQEASFHPCRVGRHSNVVTPLDRASVCSLEIDGGGIGNVAIIPFPVMLRKGRDFNVKGLPSPPLLVAGWLSDALNGLSWLHEHCGIVHGDVTMSNILFKGVPRDELGNGLEAMVADMGSSMIGNVPWHLVIRGTTHAMTTKYYRPPEYFQSRSYPSYTGDLWSLYVAVGQMLTPDLHHIRVLYGEKFYSEGVWPDHAVFDHTTKGSIPFVRSDAWQAIYRECPQLAVVLERMSSFNPSARGTARELLETLRCDVPRRPGWQSRSTEKVSTISLIQRCNSASDVATIANVLRGIVAAMSRTGKTGATEAVACELIVRSACILSNAHPGCISEGLMADLRDDMISLVNGTHGCVSMGLKYFSTLLSSCHVFPPPSVGFDENILPRDMPPNIVRVEIWSRRVIEDLRRRMTALLGREGKGRTASDAGDAAAAAPAGRA